MITKPMLATDFEESKLKFPCIVQPKIDGVRALHLYGKPTISGRSLKQFANKLILPLFNLEGIDGELTYGPITAPNLCRVTTSVVNTLLDDRATDLILYAFDYVTPETVHLTYQQRYDKLFTLNLPPNIKIVPSTIVNNLQELENFENQCLLDGYEGVIIRDPNGLYKNGRATVREGSYLRIKRFTQEDAVVLSITEAMENTNEAITNELGRTERSSHKENKIPKGMLGNLVCLDIKTQQQIIVGPGEMTHEDRIFYFNNPSELIGQTISYKFFPKGVKDKPRFPTFVSIRPSEDLVKD